MSYEKVEQLKKLLELYPNVPPVPIEGIIIDYLNSTTYDLCELLSQYDTIYYDLFENSKNEEKAKTIIKLICSNSENIKKLIESCNHKFPRVVELINKVVSYKKPELGSGKPSENLNTKLLIEKIKKQTFTAKIWQLSDIHFGEFNKIVDDPYELASILSKICYDYEWLIPDIILVSGDLTSYANKEEFDKFITFAEKLSKEAWGELRPKYFLVVPGNHDTKWIEGQDADKLQRFQEHISQHSEVVTTPFQANLKDHSGRSTLHDEVVVEYYNLDNERTPPIALVKYKKLSVEFLLLISSFYSGTIPDDIKDTLEQVKRKGTKKELVDLIRIDDGFFSREYISLLSQYLKNASENTRLALTHHNLCRYGAETCKNSLAPEILKTLYDNEFRLVFHGHVHLVEDNSKLRRYDIRDKEAFPVPCTTLTSEVLVGDKGFNIHFIEDGEHARTVRTCFFPISQNTFFDLEKIKDTYCFNFPIK